MALSIVNFNSYFRYDTAPYELRIDDITDYVTPGITKSNVKIVIKAETSSGDIFYQNVNYAVPDIDPDIDDSSVITIQLPLNGSGLPLQDTYTITLTYKVSTEAPYNVTKVKTFTLDYASPTVEISMEVDCITPRLTATDESVYTINGYDPIITRAFSIHYPPSTPTADVTGTGSSLYTATFYTVADSTVEHSSSLTSTLTYNFGGGFYVADSVTGSEVIQVSCDGDLCDIYCCIRSQWNRYVAIKGKNNVLAQNELAIFYQITSLAEMVGLALKCGKSTHISDYVAEILLLANCDSGCSCTDGVPQLVTGLGVSGSSVTVGAGTGVSVSLNGSEYTVSLSTVNIAKLAATYNAVVAAGTNISSVSSASVTAGNVTTTTYTVNSTDTIVESKFVEVLMTMVSGALPIYTIVSQKVYGTVFKTTLSDSGIAEFIEIQNISSAAAWQGNYTKLIMKNFFTGATSTYYPEIYSIEEITSKASLTATDVVSVPNKVKPSIYYKDGADKFWVKFFTPTGVALGRDMDAVGYLRLIIKLNA